MLALTKVWPLSRTSRKTLKTQAPGNCRGKALLFVLATVCDLRPLLWDSSSTYLTHCLHRVLSAFQNSRQKITPIRILNIPPVSYPKRHPSTLTKTIPLATHGNHKTEFRQRMVFYNKIVKGARLYIIERTWMHTYSKALRSSTHPSRRAPVI